MQEIILSIIGVGVIGALLYISHRLTQDILGLRRTLHSLTEDMTKLVNEHKQSVQNVAKAISNGDEENPTRIWEEFVKEELK